MLESLSIENFRGIASGELKPFGKINVLVGANNSGKSTCLEALLLLAEMGTPGVAEAMTFVANRRGANGLAAFDSLFTDRAYRKFVIGGPTGKGVVEQASVQNPGMFRCFGIGFRVALATNLELHYAGTQAQYLDVDRGRFPAGLLEKAISAAELAGQRRQLVELLRPLLPSIADLRLLLREQTVAYVEEKDGSSWPVLSGGDGFTRLISMASKLVSARAGAVMIEEPEAFQHPGSLVQVAKLFWETTKQDTQLFIATHSLEFIDALVAAAGNSLEDLELFRLRLDNRQLLSARLNGVEVKARREDLHEDLRR